MALELHEAWETDEGQDGQSPSDRRKFTVIGEANPATDDADNGAVIQAYARANVPATYNGRSLQDVNRTRIGPGFWLVEASYASNQFTPTGEKTFTFSTGGGSQQITRAKRHIQTYKRSLTDGTTSTGVSEFDGWLNPGKGGEVNGTTIDTGSFEFQIGLYIAPADMSAEFVALLFHLTDTSNATTFTATIQGVPFTFAPGECRFKGATGSLRGYGDWELGLSFSAQPNATGVDIPGFTGVSFKGQHHLSFVSAAVVTGDDDKFVAPKATHLLVDEVYPEDNWTGLLGP